jgi:hypothetical protein
MQFPARTELMRLLTFSTRENLSPRAGLRQGQTIVDLAVQGFPAREDQAKWAKLMREAGIKSE